MNIVWIHGFGEDSDVWEDFLPAFHLKGTSYLFDHSALTGYRTIREYAGALQVFLSEKKLDNPVLIGHSMGGYIALEYAAQYPEGVRGLGLFHSSAAADSDKKKQDRDKTRSFIEKNGSAAFIKNFYPNMFTEEFREKNENLISGNIRRYSALHREALMSATESMKNRRDHLETLRGFSFPVFQILGKMDAFVPLEKGLEQATLLQHPYTLILDRVAHAGMYEAPGVCVDFIRHYLGTC